MGNLDELASVVARGHAMLFTGAGFSSDARDIEGRPLPDSDEMRRELWSLVFDGEPDDSSLQDLYDCALMACRDRLHDYINRRLRIGDAPLPAHYRAWFTAPWKRIYTLNVDDLEIAVARQLGLPKIDVIHLNGVAGEAHAVTFSTLQYAQRLCGKDRTYEQLIHDFERAPFVFAGTTLDEVTLWQHLELRRRANAPRLDPPRSFLVSSSLSRARRVLLESLNIAWIQGRIEDVADRLLHGSAACVRSEHT